MKQKMKTEGKRREHKDGKNRQIYPTQIINHGHYLRLHFFCLVLNFFSSSSFYFA